MDTATKHDNHAQNVPEAAAGVGDAIATDSVSAFEQRIEESEDILYGVALFFECLSLLLAGQEVMTDTHRKQFRNIILTGKRRTQQAATLAEQVRQGAASPDTLRDFEFGCCEGYPDPDALRRRAQALVDTYALLFPKRPRSEPFSKDETLQLMKAAAHRCDLNMEAATPPVV